MTTIHAQAERKRQDRSVCRAEKRLCRARMLRVRGLIHPTSAVCATTDTARGEKRLPSEQNQAILKSSGRPLGECRFVLIGKGPLRARLRAEAEAEERAFYAGKAGEEWLRTLAPLGTDAEKPFLETAPWLIAIFGQRHGIDADGGKIKHYYVPESVGIATGFLIAALNEAGLATLTHTPSPMGFLNEALGRPEHEKPYILLVVGHPADNATVPLMAKEKLPLDVIMSVR